MHVIQTSIPQEHPVDICTCHAMRCKEDSHIIYTHTHPILNTILLSVSVVVWKKCRKESITVWLRSEKCHAVIKEESLLWLCCLFQFQIQSFVRYCCFPRVEESHAHPHRLLAEPIWDLTSHWLEGTPGSIWEVLLCLHASEENPKNNCYLEQPDNL